MHLQYCWLKTFDCLFCFCCTEGTFDYLFFHSWNKSVQILELTPNDEKSIWLVGRDNSDDVVIGFIVSFFFVTSCFDCP